MKITRKYAGAALAAAVLGLSACAATTAPAPAVDPAAIASLAPTGTLRIGVYPGSPTSFVRDAGGGRPASPTS